MQIRKKSEQHRMLGRAVGKLVKSVDTHFAGMVLCIGKAIPKCCSKEISEQKDCRENIRLNWI